MIFFLYWLVMTLKSNLSEILVLFVPSKFVVKIIFSGFSPLRISFSSLQCIWLFPEYECDWFINYIDIKFKLLVHYEPIMRLRQRQAFHSYNYKLYHEMYSSFNTLFFSRLIITCGDFQGGGGDVCLSMQVGVGVRGRRVMWLNKFNHIRIINN